MSNVDFNNNSNPVDADIAHLHTMWEQILSSGNSAYNNPDSDDEEIKLKKISLEENELLLFKNTHKGDFLSMTDMIQVSDLQNGVLSIFNSIFADVFNVKLVLDMSRGGYIFVTAFRYMTDEQFTAAQNDSPNKLIRAMNSSMNPEEIDTKSVAKTLLFIIQKQQQSCSDASKYASFSKDAKALLTELLYQRQQNPKKKKWILGDNYSLETVQGTSYNNRTYTNIIGTLYLDAEKVISMIASVADEENNWEFRIRPVTTNIIGTDSLVEIVKVNKTKKRNLSNKYGIHFQK